MRGVGSADRLLMGTDGIWVGFTFSEGRSVGRTLGFGVTEASGVGFCSLGFMDAEASGVGRSLGFIEADASGVGYSLEFGVVEASGVGRLSVSGFGDSVALADPEGLIVPAGLSEGFSDGRTDPE
jgi:hypothetical protein